MPPRQFALPFPHVPSFAAEDFQPAPSNAAALALLADGAVWPQGRLVLYGPAGSGKTHLLHVWAARHAARYMPAASLRGLPEAGNIAVDDADLCHDQAALFHLLNANAERGFLTLLAGREAPARWPLTLPDLISRVRAALSIGLTAPDDALLQALFLRLVSDRQLQVPDQVRQWVLLHLPREAGVLREAVARLDRAAMAAGGRITRALAMDVLADLAADHEAASSGAEESARLPT